jgi:hypothetical protein
MHLDDPDADVEEVLVLRVVSAAQRRRVRRAVVGGLLVIVAAGGTAIGLTHRSGAAPRAFSTPAVGVHLDNAVRAEIYAVARARYASVLDRSDADLTRGRSKVEFGRLTVTGDRATLRVNLVCVPLCGHGDELTLARRDGAWRVIAVRQIWLS